MDTQTKPEHRYEVHFRTLFGGWSNCWTVEGEDGERPQSYPTIGEAQAEIDGVVDDLNQQIADGEREPGNTYEAGDYRIYDNRERRYVS